MNRAFKRILPILFAIIVILSLVWYLFIYDTDFTRDVLVQQARYFESKGKHSISAWLYNQAYAQSDGNETVAIELAERYKASGNYTKAELTLSKALANNPTVNLYIALCKTYVEQDKLLDAVTMLDNIQDPNLKSQIDALRPKAPTASPAPGYYNLYIIVNITAASGNLYVSTTREYPSTANLATGTGINLVAGENTIRAVTVDENGLVSPLSTLVYTVGNVIEELKINDSSMDAAIRAKLGLDPDTKLISTQLWTITEFSVPADAQSVEDLANLSYLQKLVINGCGATDFTALGKLTQLTDLTIQNCVLSDDDIETIGKLPNLQKLTINNCDLTDISGLSNAKKLAYADLSSNTIKDLSALTFLSTLKTLNLSDNALVSLNDLSALTNLETLNVSGNSITSLVPLSTCTALKTLDVSTNLLTNLSGVESLSALTSLSAAYNHLNDVTAAGACANLEQLNISNNELKTIDALSFLTKLQVLDFSRNNVTVLPSWNKDNALVTINGAHNKITTLASLAGYPKLNNILMDNNKISSVKALTSCPLLLLVEVYDNPVSDVSALKDKGIEVKYKPR